MGKCLKTKDSDLQGRVIRKTRKKPTKTARKSLKKFTTDHDDHLKFKKAKRKLQHSKDLDPPLKKHKEKVEVTEDTGETKPENSPNEVVSEFHDVEIELRNNESTNKSYLKLIRQDEDLFADDDLKARYDQFTKFNFIFHIFDEIALEGLDGITIEAYWKRLKVALKSPTCIEHIKEVIWHIICLNNRIMFFELPEPRQNLIILSRDVFLNKETNIFTEVYQTGPELYKIEYAPKGDVWGSCATLSTRIDISEQVRNMTLDEAYSTYKNKLVMVADQTLRINALFDELTDPNYEYTQTEYCLLERIGRSRELGEITQGSAALTNFFGMDSKSLYHYCKGFKRENLITKQFLCVRSTVDQSKIGRLLQLRRFYIRKKSKYMLVAENIINYLKKCPDYKAPYRNVKSMFCGQLHSKFFKNQEFLKFVDTQLVVPFKEYHPEATYKEYMTKGLGKERVIQMMQLKDPFVNIAANWSDSQQLDSSDDDDDEDDNDDDVKIVRGRIFNMEFIREVYLLIHSKGHEGCTTQEVNAIFDVDFSTTRSVLKKLISRNLLQSKRQDMGRQKTNQYVATCIIENPNPKMSETLTTVTTESSSAIERLKERQQQKIDSLEKDRVYNREKFEADRQLDILRLDNIPSLLPLTFTVPQIICEYFISKLVQSKTEETVFLAEFKHGLRPFQINLTYPKLGDNVTITLRQIAPSTGAVQTPKLTMHSSNIYSSVLKSDYLTKACLLQAHFGSKMINSREVIELLEPNFNKSKAVKRDRPVHSKEPQASTSQGDSLLNTKRLDLSNYMGPNPVLISREEDESGEVVAELYLSTPPDAYKTGDITKYDNPSDISTTERVLSRINIVLKTVNTTQVFEEVHKLLRVIFSKESEDGYDKKMDRKSLHRIISRLATEGYIKLYQCIVSNKNLRKSQNFICHPDVDHHHPTIRNGIDQIKFRFVCGSKKHVEVLEQVQKKPKPVEMSPFGEYDVLQSIQEIQELRHPNIVSLKPKWSRRAGKLYGHRPKFARMSLLHEILFYLIYVMDKNAKPLPEEEILELFKTYKIDLTDEDLSQLPPVYCKEISWKMFIPPLPRHQGWKEGWTLICDVILRIPITLMVRLYCLNFLSSELQELLFHPIKRFYLIKNLPAQIQYLLMYKRKCIYDIHFVLVRLAYCGLLQFGPARYKEKEQGFIYLNRKASLLETMTSEPGYHKVTDKPYNKVSFYFDTLDSVSKYWFTMHNICMSTLLNARHVVEGKTITFIDVTAKPSLNKAVSAKTQQDVEKYDNGDIPGDNRGAAGLDSAMWSHIQRNWIYFAQKPSKNFRDELASLKMKQSMSESVSFEHLQLPLMANKFYLSKPGEPRPFVPSRKIKHKRTSKSIPVVRKLVPPHKVIKLHKKEYYDAVDKAILRKYSGIRFRPTWSEEEDKVIMLLKVASTFVTPGGNKQLITYTVLRDILHRVIPESRSKTSRAIQRRFKVLARDVPLMSQMLTLVHNLYKLVPVARYFVPLRNYIMTEKDGLGKKFKLSEPELNNAFVFMAYYMANHRKEVETALHGNLTTLDYFNQESLDFTVKNIVPVDQDAKNYQDPATLEEVRKYVLKDLFHSALGHKAENPAWSYQIYKLCQKFNQDILKLTFEELRDQHMMTTKKHQMVKNFFNAYKLSLTYVFAHTTTFTYHTMEEAYTAFSEFKNAPENFHVQSDLIEDKKYGQMFGLNEVITFMLDQANFKFWFPEHHFILNPAIEDHSPVIDELAKRYQAKMKHSEKDSELQDIAQSDITFTQVTEPEAGPSTAGAEDIEIIQFDDDAPLDLTITSTNSTTITNLKHWISDCIDAERVRSPSPELLTLDVNHEHADKQANDQQLSDEAVELREEKVLTLEEIKEEILTVTPPNEKRRVPYITDLAKLLSENFDEIDTDEQTVDEMKKHFVQQYPRLEELDVEGFSNHYLAEYLENRPGIKEIWKQVERETYVADRSKKSDAFDEILEKGGTMEDIELASEIIYFVNEKGTFGATASELKDKFEGSQGNCSLEYIIKKLTSHKILLRTGVCTITFVHYNHQNPWLIDTFALTDEHVKLFKKDGSKDGVKKLEEDIDARLGTTNWLKVKIVPWAKVDGSLDKNVFKLWLSSVLSYCVDNPKALLTSFFDKFCFAKPVDIFYLLEILQDLGCLEMRRFLRPTDLFSEYEWNQDCRATVLDKFEDIYIEPNQISFCALGSFFNV